MSHNEHEIIEAKKLARELNMDIRFKLTWAGGYIPKNPEFIRRETGLNYLNREEVKKKTGRNYMSPCKQLWEFPEINWDGRLLGRCSVYKKDFGVNVFEVGLKNCINSTEYINLKKFILGIEGGGAIHNPCTECSYLISIQNDANFFDIDNIQV